MMNGLKLSLIGTSALALLMLGNVLVPQSAYAADDGALGVIEEILVTARKREESVLEIPETVAVISGEAIARRDITTLDDIGNGIANLNLSKRADGFPNVSIRGLGSFGNTQGVGFYLDDAQIFSDASSRFGDLDRIEVLKGPQGTLYGGSNIGGAVKFVSKRPDPEEVSGRVKVRAGQQSIIDLEGSVNVPLGDSGWAMRVFGFYNDDEGYLTNPNNARLNGLRSNPDPDEGQFEELGGRFSIAGSIGEQLSVFAAVRYNEYDGPNNAWVRELDDDLDYPDEVANTFNSSHKRETFSGTLELTWELDSIDVVSLTSYTDTESDRYTDVDIREEYIFDAFRPETMDVFTQEIRISSTHDGAFQWIAGGFYSMFEETMDSVQIFFNALDDDGNIIGPLGCIIGTVCSGVWVGDTTLTLDEEERSLALPFEVRNRDKSHLGGFFNGTYTWEEWEASVGIRVDQWKNESDNLDSGISSDTDDVEILPRISISRWVNEDHMVYFTFSEGYEPGGFNSATLSGSDELFGFGPERAASYELGWKGRAIDGRLFISAAAFYVDYDGKLIEFQAETDDGLVEGIFNAGDSEQFGLELEAQLQVNDYLTLTGSFGWVDAEWGSNTVVQGVDVSGTTPPVVQDVNWHLGADFERPIRNTGLNLIAAVQVNHSGEYKGLQVWDTVDNPSYTLVNVQVGVASDRWELTLNVKNLFDEDHYVDLQRFPNLYTLDGGENILIGTRGQPQLITGNLTVRF